MANFTDATRVDPTEADDADHAYAVELDPEWTVNGRPHGGYLLAVLARAAMQTTPDHPDPLSTSAVYPVSPECGPATVTVEPLRRGRLASQVRARLVQKDRACVEAVFTMGRLDPDQTERWVDAPPPEITPLEHCPVTPIAPPGAGVRVAMLDMIEQRVEPLSYQGRGRADGSGDLRGWLRFADGSRFDPVSLLYAADSFPPATFTIGSVGWVPTLELTVYIRHLPADGPLRVRQRARVLAGGLVDQVCEAWDSRDRVVLQATQLAVRMRDDSALSPGLNP